MNPWEGPPIPAAPPPAPPPPDAPTAERLGFLPRFGAEIIDVIATWALVLLVSAGSFIGLGAIGLSDEVVVTIGVLAGIVAFLAYWTVLHAHGRQTVGKMVIGAVVVDTDLRPIGYGRALGRLFAEALSAIPLNLGYLWAIWDPERQTFHDKIVGTLVIRKADLPT